MEFRFRPTPAIFFCLKIQEIAKVKLVKGSQAYFIPFGS